MRSLSVSPIGEKYRNERKLSKRADHSGHDNFWGALTKRPPSKPNPWYNISMKKLLFIILFFLCGCYGAGVNTTRPIATETPSVQERPQPIKHKTITVPLNVATAPKEKTDTTEEYLFWIILGIFSTIFFAALIILKDKKLAERIKKRNGHKHPKHNKAKPLH